MPNIFDTPSVHTTGKQVEKPPPPTLQDASASIEKRIEDLDKKIKDIDAELIRYREQLKRAKGATEASLKKRALDTLKRKKMYEQQRDQLSAQSFNVAQTAFAIESVKDTQTTIAAMKAASVVLKAENKKMNISEIEDMQDDFADMLEDFQEVNEAMSRSYGVPDGCDEEDLEAELALLSDELEADDIDEGQKAAFMQAPAAHLPNVPSIMYPNAPQAVVGGAQVGVDVDEYGLPLNA
jgi:charged multivesicular body protein 5